MSTENIMNSSIPSIAIFVRHSADCSHLLDGKVFRQCRCKKHLRSFRGKPDRVSARTRSWTEAEARKREIEDRFRPATEKKLPTPVENMTIGAAVEKFIELKKPDVSS